MGRVGACFCSQRLREAMGGKRWYVYFPENMEARSDIGAMRLEALREWGRFGDRGDYADEAVRAIIYREKYGAVGRADEADEASKREGAMESRH